MGVVICCVVIVMVGVQEVVRNCAGDKSVAIEGVASECTNTFVEVAGV